jgi:hypothetical protein
MEGVALQTTYKGESPLTRVGGGVCGYWKILYRGFGAEGTYRHKGFDMLDKRTSALLQTINDCCDSGSYKIFSEQDFLDSFPQKWGVTNDTLGQMLAHLSENGYINVKYSGGGMYCVCPLPLGRGYCEQEKERQDECSSQLKYFMAAAFFGAFVGSALSATLFALILFLR